MPTKQQVRLSQLVFIHFSHYNEETSKQSFCKGSQGWFNADPSMGSQSCGLFIGWNIKNWLAELGEMDFKDRSEQLHYYLIIIKSLIAISKQDIISQMFMIYLVLSNKEFIIAKSTHVKIMRNKHRHFTCIKKSYEFIKV